MSSDLPEQKSEEIHVTGPKENLDDHVTGPREKSDDHVSFRAPSTSVYVVASVAVALALFFLLWWMLNTSGDEAPWIPAGLAASVVLLVALAAREVVLRRALTRHILEKERRDYRVADFRRKKRSVSLDYYSSAMRALQKHSDAADKQDALPEAHLEVYQACREYLAKVDDALRASRLSAQSAVTLRAGQERARTLQKHHLLLWAAASAREWTSESQKRLQPEKKAEVARKALDVIDSALKIYPNEPQLLQSANAIREHIASLRVAHWVELAERASFKGQTTRAIEHYQDALFYLSKDKEMGFELRLQIAERINAEIENLRSADLREEKEIAKQDAHIVDEASADKE